MKRGMALIASTFVLGACGSGAAKGPSVHATVAGTEWRSPHRSVSRTLEIWQDKATRDLTFHWDGDNASEAWRYIPSRLSLVELSGGTAVSVTRYPSKGKAWLIVHELYGVTRGQVRDAVTAGRPSAAAPTAGVRVAFTGLVVPRLNSLGGDPLISASRSSGAATLTYGRRDRLFNEAITVDIRRHLPAYFRRLFRTHPKHRAAGVRYAEDSGNGDIIFPYRSSEWIDLLPTRTPSRQELASMIREILAAPTSG